MELPSNKKTMKNLFQFIYLLLLVSCGRSGTTEEKQISISCQPTVSMPLFKSNNEENDTLSSVFHIAIGDLFTNIRMRHTAEKGKEKPILFAGFDYTGAWTRDASINVWSGAGLIYPEIAKNTLLENLITDEHQDTIIGGQYWDKIIWTIGAWNLYLYHGDKSFLRTAYQASIKTLAQLEKDEFDTEKNLFRGGAVYGDGIAAYDDLYTQTGDYLENGPWLSNVDKWPQANPDKKAKTGWGLPMMTLSTNCVYAEVYRILPLMEKELQLTQTTTFEQKEKRMKAAINKQFWNAEKGHYSYYIDPWKTCDFQEGLGLSFALLFGIAPKENVENTLAHVVTEPAGIPCVYPSFSRYLDKEGKHVGRHSGSVWTHVQGFWAHAAALNGDLQAFDHEFSTLRNHTMRDMQFREIYHPKTGLAYGGLQEDGFEKGKIREWKSTERQTWGATAYLRMVFNGLFGMNFSENGIDFKPVVPKKYENLRLIGIPYRKAMLNLYVSGAGTKIKSFKLNGKETLPQIPASSEGKLTIDIEME